MCCRQDLLPECIDTLCESTYSARCPQGYREQSRGNQGCSSSLDTKLYCCSDSRQLGHCYNTTCTNSGEAECRRGYVMTARGKGVEWGCPWTAYKSTCCETASWNGGRGNFYHNIGQIIVVSFLVSFLRAYVSVQNKNTSFLMFLGTRVVSSGHNSSSTVSKGFQVCKKIVFFCFFCTCTRYETIGKSEKTIFLTNLEVPNILFNALLNLALVFQFFVTFPLWETQGKYYMFRNIAFILVSFMFYYNFTR